MLGKPGSLRAVVLFHSGIPDPHFDLMFESAPGSRLLTWRCPVWPIISPTAVEKLPDHRPDYLDFEGEISQSRGHVSRVYAENRGRCCESGPALFVFTTPTQEFQLAKHGDQWVATLEFRARE